MRSRRVAGGCQKFKPRPCRQGAAAKGHEKMISFQHNTWLVEEEYDQFCQLAPREWHIVETERWYHEGARTLTGTKLAISFDIYAETADEVNRFWCWFNAHLDGSPSANVDDRKTKWMRPANAA